jgi:hypothetical protein
MGSDIDTNRTWVVADENDVSVTFSTASAVNEYFDQMESQATGELTLWEEIMRPEKKNVWKQLLSSLGGPPQTHRVHLELVWNANVAALIFLNPKGQEQRVLAESPIPVSDEIRSTLSFGELTPLDSRYCLPKSQAFQIVRQYLESQSIADGIKYEIVG